MKVFLQKNDRTRICLRPALANLLFIKASPLIDRNAEGFCGISVSGLSQIHDGFNTNTSQRRTGARERKPLHSISRR